MKKPVRMKKLRILLHKDKKENVLRRLFDEGSFQLENVEVEGLPEKGKQTTVTVEAMSLLSKIEEIRGVFGEVGIKAAEEEKLEKVHVAGESADATPPTSSLSRPRSHSTS